MRNCWNASRNNTLLTPNLVFSVVIFQSQLPSQHIYDFSEHSYKRQPNNETQTSIIIFLHFAWYEVCFLQEVCIECIKRAFGSSRKYIFLSNNIY